MLKTIPHLLISDAQGRFSDIPQIAMAGRSGNNMVPVTADTLIPLPEGSQLYFLPQRKAMGYDRKTGELIVFDDAYAVAAYIPPSYTHYLMAAYETITGAPRLPLFSFTAVGYYRGRYYVPAVHVDEDIKQLPTSFDDKKVKHAVDAWIVRHPNNRLLAHHGHACAIEYGCPNAKNLFLGRWEAPVAVASACNANCVGCISFQPKESVPSPQNRLEFVPTVEEIVEYAVPHLEKAEHAILSFGQGCEGEPLLRGKLIEDSIRAIRRHTKRGVIHINTNGSKPDTLARLFDAGLDSVRVSMNSAQPDLYHRYYKPNNYTFDDVVRSLKVARDHKKFASINYFVFPGITDSQAEIHALMDLITDTKLHLIQWRNFNIDPDWYLNDVVGEYRSKAAGVPSLMRRVREKFPHLLFGYMNKPAEVIQDAVDRST